MKSSKRHSGPKRAVMACAALALATALAVLLDASALEADGAQSAQKEKAVFIYQFTRFVEWPDDSFEAPDAPLRIYALGDKELSETLRDLVADKDADGHPFKVIAPTGKEDPASCHILYIAADHNRKAYQSVLGPASTLPVLTVSDAEDFTTTGGVVRLCEHENELLIEVNIDAAARHNLKISSRLLRLADVVRDK